MSHHIKRIPAPRTWAILRKAKKFIIKPSAGPHNQREALPITVVIRDLLGYAKTVSQVKILLLNKKVLIDGRFIRDVKFPFGLFDIISFPDVNEHYRLLMNLKNKLYLEKVPKEEARIKIVKIVGKKIVKGKKQYTFNDGRNLLSDEEYYTSDSLVMQVPEQKVLKHLPFEIGSLAYLIAGNHVGEIGKINEVVKERRRTQVIIENKKGKFETLKDYVIIIGKDKPEVKMNSNK